MITESAGSQSLVATHSHSHAHTCTHRGKELFPSWPPWLTFKSHDPPPFKSVCFFYILIEFCFRNDHVDLESMVVEYILVLQVLSHGTLFEFMGVVAGGV